ncbi:hypothetical protein J8A71_00125 [Mycoplasmopsis agalactiae]|uniref:hypothetical protein n=1 Tax=Mycoplasmopsis agalactiae TaxID=2110 RepID=UPI001F1829CA|nr:hypothetical protein [Mycoplasmopsis agalactiae]MCE6061326.1 hypothetical protein [Mycoplasmopsis agalactiae]
MKIKKLLLIAPLSAISMSFVAARCAKDESKQTEIINAGANRVEELVDESTESYLNKLSQQSDNKNTNDSEQNLNHNITNNLKSSELVDLKNPIKKELKDD